MFFNFVLSRIHKPVAQPLSTSHNLCKSQDKCCLLIPVIISNTGCSDSKKKLHNCTVKVSIYLMLSDTHHWKVSIDGQHVPDDTPFRPPLKPHKMSEAVKEDILKMRLSNTRPKEIFRHQLGNDADGSLITVLGDTRYHPTEPRVRAFIRNVEYHHDFRGGQWSSVDQLIRTQAKKDGHVLLYQQGNPVAAANDSDRPWILCLTNQSALKAARDNQPVMGIDGKHGLQDDGAILQTATTMHKEGFGCPAAFTFLSRENVDTIEDLLQAILDNVPCGNTECEHRYQYFNLPGTSRGFKRVSC